MKYTQCKHRIQHDDDDNKKDLLPFKCDEAANERTRKFLESVVKICTDYIERENDRSEKVINFYQPDEIMKMFDFSIPDCPTDLERLIEDCKRTLALQVHTGKYDADSSRFVRGPSELVAK